MSRPCLYDRDCECLADCPDCSGYEPQNYCENCGGTTDLYYFETGSAHGFSYGKYYCENCLPEYVMPEGIIKESDPVSEFLLENDELFLEFLKDYYSDCKAKNFAEYS